VPTVPRDRQETDDDRGRIFKLASNTAIMDVRQEFDIDKLSFFLVERSNSNGPNKVLTHYMDLDRFLVVAADIAQCAFVQCWPNGYKEFKGTPKNGGYEARMLEIAHVQGNKYPYIIRLSRGPGEKIGNGAVKMIREEISGKITVSDFDMRAMCLRVTQEAQAYRTARHLAEITARRSRTAG